MKFNRALIVIVFSFLSLNLYAQIYTAKGLGSSFDEAKTEAVNNAIKFSVGEFVVNKEVMDDDTFSQKVVSHSNAYVKKISIISQEKLSDDEYQVEVEVDIESQKIIGALRDLNVKVIENAVDNSTLLEAINHFDKNDINKSIVEDFEALVNELLVSPVKERKAIVHVETIGKLKPLKPAEGASLFPLELNLVIYPDKNYISTVRRVLEEARPNGDIKRSSAHSLSVLETSQDDMIYEFGEIDLSKNGNQTHKKYKISHDKYLILKRLITGLYVDYGKIRLELFDKNGETISIFDYCGTNACINQGKTLNYKDSTNVLKWDVRGCSDSQSLVLNCRTFAIGKANVMVKFELTKEQIMNLQNVKVGFVSMYE